jgi:Tfp pilus assembly protein PilP
MSSGKAAFYGVGGALLAACLAAANMPTRESPPDERTARPVATTGPEALAVEVRSQAARLHARMSEAPVPDQNLRNPFSFGQAPRAARRADDRMVHAAVVAEPAPPVFTPPLPSLTLMGIAEEVGPGGVRRTAVIGGDGDTIHMVTEGQAVGDRYKVTKIGADAVELEDLVTKGYRRLALR